MELLEGNRTELPSIVLECKVKSLGFSPALLLVWGVPLHLAEPQFLRLPVNKY